MAWFWTEGRINNQGPGKRSTVVISQSHVANPENVDRTRNLLERIYGKQTPTFTKGTRWKTDSESERRENIREEKDRTETEFRLNVGIS